ncbi:protein kinase domain-containing protein [Variovorax sp. VNK109]|uniref:protein kinase domain-containing protein n=1 Tax=Variovorax sp. VNK109 TaxID=3400919 RepID=UPI003C01CE1E
MSEHPPPAAPAPRSTLALKPGQSMLEYRIEQTLGGGGFGITYLARDANLNLPVALKEYLPADLACRMDDGAVQPLGESSQEQFKWGLERFLDEARALATFRHPNIVRVLRYFTANGTAYIVMEYESGRSLKQWLSGRMPVDRDTLLKIVMPLLDGIELIHKAGFLHRDIKPDNIYMRADGSPVLIDFGSARSTTTGRDLTTIVSPGFAPFEQYHSAGHQGPWSDIYSLAAVMYWMVSGNKPVEAAARLKRDGLVPALQCGNPELVGEAVLKAIDWALDPDEERRPQTVAEFRDRLNAATGAIPMPGGAPTQRLPTAPAPPPDVPRGNMVCSVLFLDIVAYSKASVSEQYEVKKHFNELITGKLAHIPQSTRITLDTGDGAAVCFMGDPEIVLHTAVDIRRSLAAHERLRVRMGLHMGPVRILNDMNDRVNVIGDGINAAQRVMSFAGENALLVSRAFYDVVSCLSDGAERAFRHIGAQADKHGRMHELYETVDDSDSDALADRTIQLPSDSPSGTPPAQPTESFDIDPATLAAIERDLAQLLGPLAPVLMRKARGRARTAQDLRELLAHSIADPQQRDAFLASRSLATLDNSSRSRSASAPSGAASSATPSSSPSSRSAAGLGTTSASSTSVPVSVTGSVTASVSGPVSQSAASARPWLPQETATRLEKLLAQTVGPVARVLVKNEVRKATDFAGLCQALAMHVDDPQTRAQFLKDALKLKPA